MWNFATSDFGNGGGDPSFARSRDSSSAAIVRATLPVMASVSRTLSARLPRKCAISRCSKILIILRPPASFGSIDRSHSLS